MVQGLAVMLGGGGDSDGGASARVSQPPPTSLTRSALQPLRFATTTRSHSATPFSRFSKISRGRRENVEAQV